MLQAAGFNGEQQEDGQRGRQLPEVRRRRSVPDDQIPDDLPDIVQPRARERRAEQNGEVRRLRRQRALARNNQSRADRIPVNFQFIVLNERRRRNEVVRWNIQAVPTPSRNDANAANTQRAVEEYFLRARKNGGDPHTFLHKYYRFETLPPLGKLLSLRHYCLYKSRIQCNRAGVHIPRMDAECQRQLYYHMLEGLNDYASYLDGRPIEPRPPHIFNPIFNPVTGSYQYETL